VVGVLPYKQLANHVYGLIVFPSPAVYSNPYSNPPTGCSRAVTIGLAIIKYITINSFTGLYNACKSVMKGNHGCEIKGFTIIFIVDEHKTSYLCAEG
jgi:hypothetical protein